MKTILLAAAVLSQGLTTDLIAPAPADAAASAPGASQAAAQVPAGATLRAYLDAPVASHTAHAGDTVIAVLPSDLYAGDVLVAPAGARLYGRVTYAAGARETRDKGVLAIQFDALERSPGQFYAIRGPVSSAEIEEQADVAEGRSDAMMVIGGAILGGVIGNQVGRDREGRRDARWIGAATGAALGYLASTQSGADFTLRRGTRLVITLTRGLDPGGPVYGSAAAARSALDSLPEGASGTLSPKPTPES